MSRAQLLSAVSNWLAFAATLAVAFFLTPVLLGHLGAACYGVWRYAESILAFFTLLDMGLAACLVRGVAQHHAKSDSDALNRLANTVLALFSGAGLIALAVGVPVMLAIAPRLGAEAGDAAGVTLFLLVMLTNLAATLPLSVFPSILDGLDRYATKSGVRIAFLALRTAAVVLAVQQGAGLLTLAVIFTIANAAEHATLALLVFRFLPGLRLRACFVNRATFREIRRYSVDAFLAMLAGRITLRMGVILLGLFQPMSLVAVFEIASSLVEYAKTLLRTITATLTPGVSALEARSDWPGIRALFLGATRFVLYIVLPVQLGLWWFGTPFLVRWVPEIGAQGALPLAILSLTLTLSVAQSVASRMLYGLGRLRFFARLAVGEAALNALLLVALIPLFGVPGVAIAVAVPNLIFCAAVIVHASRQIGVNASDYLAAWTKPLLAATAPAMLWSLLPPAQATWPSIVSSILIGLGPYCLIVILLESRLGTVITRVSARIARRTRPSSSRR